MIRKEEIVYINAKLIALAKDLDLIAPNYDATVYWNNVKTNFLTQISIYIDKQKCIKLPLIDTSDVCSDEVIRIARDTLEAYEGSLNKRKYDFYDALAKLTKANDYKYELTKENELIMSKKSAQEIEFEQFEAQKRAEADAEVAEFNAGIDKEIEDKRRELREAQKKADANDRAAEFWYFYDGLIENGFSEEQAMQILLAVAKK